MSLQPALSKVVEKQDLTAAEMTAVMRDLLQGHASPAQIGALLIALRMKGETVTEITAAAKTMREFALQCQIHRQPVVDIVGTGGDQSNTFNISTTSAFVVAAAGGVVAKSGNRSVSSQSGSADVLEAAGVHLSLSPTQVSHCINQLGIGFMFAPNHHSATRHVSAPRKELGLRTFFNLLGPLTNPANAPHTLLGVYHEQWLLPMAQVLKQLGVTHALVVHSADGLDEISIASETHVAELKSGQINTFTVHPEQFGLASQPLDSLLIQSAQESLDLMQQVLANQSGPARDIVVLNAGAALYAADICTSIAAGIERAQDVIANGQAQQKFLQLIQLTRELANGTN